MANPHYTSHKERQAVKGKPTPPKRVKGPGATPGAIVERTATWPRPMPTWGTSFNRTMRAPVVKTRSAKHGVD